MSKRHPWWMIFRGARDMAYRLAEAEQIREAMVPVLRERRWVIEDCLAELRVVKATGTASPNPIPEDDGCPPIDYLIERCERALK